METNDQTDPDQIEQPAVGTPEDNQDDGSQYILTYEELKEKTREK